MKEFDNAARKTIARLKEWASDSQYWNTNKFQHRMRDIWELAGPNFEDAGSQDDYISIPADKVEEMIESRDTI